MSSLHGAQATLRDRAPRFINRNAPEDHRSGHRCASLIVHAMITSRATCDCHGAYELGQCSYNPINSLKNYLDLGSSIFTCVRTTCNRNYACSEIYSIPHVTCSKCRRSNIGDSTFQDVELTQIHTDGLVGPARDRSVTAMEVPPAILHSRPLPLPLMGTPTNNS